VRDQTRKVMKDALALKNKEIDDWGMEVDRLQQLLAAAKVHRDTLKGERDLIKQDLDLDPDPEGPHIEHHEAGPEVQELEEMLATEPETPEEPEPPAKKSGTK
jgi:hypothetical protein